MSNMANKKKKMLLLFIYLWYWKREGIGSPGLPNQTLNLQPLHVSFCSDYKSPLARSLINSAIKHEYHLGTICDLGKVFNKPFPLSLKEMIIHPFKTKIAHLAQPRKCSIVPFPCERVGSGHETTPFQVHFTE